MERKAIDALAMLLVAIQAQAATRICMWSTLLIAAWMMVANI